MTRSRELAELASAYDSGSLGFRNRIINGDMRINQRGFNSSSGIANAAYTVDRWQYRGTPSMINMSTNTDAPAGFNGSVNMVPFESGTPGATEFYVLAQRVEGFNIADLGLGTASATTLMLSFWVKSNLTGTFGGSVEFSVGSFVFSYTINAANTWEQKTVALSGLTSSVCVPTSTTNGTGLIVNLTAAAGSSVSATAGLASNIRYSVTGAVNFLSNASNYIRFTGVQLEAGTVATPFERRDYGRELMMCQRYYEVAANGNAIGARNITSASTTMSFCYAWKATKRAAPTVGVGYGAINTASVDGVTTYQGSIPAGDWYYPQGVTGSSEL